MNLFTFTKEIFNWKIQFLCSAHEAISVCLKELKRLFKTLKYALKNFLKFFNELLLPFFKVFFNDSHLFWEKQSKVLC